MKSIQFNINQGIARFSAGSAAKLLCIALISVWALGISACTRHLAPVANGQHTAPPSIAATPIQPDTLKSVNLTDSLIGTWKIKTTEIEKSLEKMTTYGSQTERDEMIKKQQKYQAAFLGLTTTFKKDMTFESVFNGQSDIGTWRVNRMGEIETVGRASGNTSNFQIHSLIGNVLVVKYEVEGSTMLLTFVKQQ